MTSPQLAARIVRTGLDAFLAGIADANIGGIYRSPSPFWKLPPLVGSSFPRFELVFGVQVRIWYEVTGYTPKPRFIQYRRLQADNAAPQQRISLARWHREGWAS